MPSGKYKRLSKEEQVINRDRVLALRVAGFTYDQMAEATGYSKYWLFNICKEHLTPQMKMAMLARTSMVGSVISACRVYKGVEQKQLAARVGLPHQNISQYETGAREPSIKTLKKIAEALDMQLRIDFVPKEVGHG